MNLELLFILRLIEKLSKKDVVFQHSMCCLFNPYASNSTSTQKCKNVECGNCLVCYYGNEYVNNIFRVNI